ncbi:AI-2E family transporter [Pseudotabrizicola alkalilacus]|uniref:AI-2E family transporter n=1 Tax=Pseudotabrizicola alkalilacus TaxID=2305252 RepID=A0A411YZ66_9RHOB|nr:AI-2E family transporter [Pseudotabrizicola alkalilacus]RGP36099.1 AI-2E family transporter [Pseudotabrizicola alkalilacus]
MAPVTYTAVHKFPIDRDSRPKRPRPSWPVVGLFILAMIAAIAFARDFLMPITFSILLFFVFVPVRRRLSRLGVAPGVTAAGIVFSLFFSIIALIWSVSGPAGQLIADMPDIQSALTEKLQRLRGTFETIDTAMTQIEAETGDATATGEATNAEAVASTAGIDVASAILNGLATTPGIMGQVALTLFLLFFLIASGDMLYLKIVQSFDSLREKRNAYSALREIEESLGSYLGAITLINACLGVAIGLAMWAFGMPSPLLFGLLAFSLNFIPYLGAITGVGIALLVGLVTFSDIFWPVMVAVVYLSFTTLEGQLITPYFVARRLQMNAVVVFLTVALWAWLWSVIGMIIAVPLLVVISVICDHVPGLEKLGNFLAGDDPVPLAEDEPAPAAVREPSGSLP